MGNIFIIILIFIFSLSRPLNAQIDKRGNTFIYGGGGMYAKFDSINNPITNELWNGNNWPLGHEYLFNKGSSSICDSINGDLKIMTNGCYIYNESGQFVENGDSIVPIKIYNWGGNSNRYSISQQSSLILPKGSNDQYYVLNATISDSAWNYYITQSNYSNGVPFDLLHYHIVDMKANNGLGKVIQKNVPLLQNRFMVKNGMQACRHANGYDWWLVKSAGYDSTMFYKFLVTKDGIFSPDSQVFKNIKMGSSDAGGQLTFSTKGDKICYGSAREHKLLLGDFDRCNGNISNVKQIVFPFDSTLDPFDAWQGRLDSMVRGISFSPNDSFLYVCSEFNIYQYELYNTDSASAWYHVQYGPDTALSGFGLFGLMHRAVNNKIYIGQASGTFGGFGVINYPNKKGAACGHCPRCLRDLGGYYSPTAPSNMPDYTLGAKPELCWPVANKPIGNTNQTILYPNPSNDIVNIIKQCPNAGQIIIYNTIGQVISVKNLQTGQSQETLNIIEIPSGFYVYKIMMQGCPTSTGKIEIKH
jgi:hypothetical protein